MAKNLAPFQRPSLPENSRIRDLKVDIRAISDLDPRTQNPRTHSPRQIQQIVKSIETFGWTNPVLIDQDNCVIAGHGRLEAAKQLGMDHAPTIKLTNMTSEQLRAYVIADNRLAERAGWDNDLLAIELQSLTELDLDFEIDVTGFEMAEIDILISGLDGDHDDEADQVPVANDGPAVSRQGDLWQLGNHRLLCGDATQAHEYDRLMGGQLAQMIFADAPYNVSIDGHVCGLGSIKHEDFVMASGEMSEAEYTDFLTRVFEHLAGHSVDGAIHFLCLDWRHLYEFLTAGKTAYTELKNFCVWNKSNAGMGSLYRSKHELVAVYKAGRGPHINNIALGKYGRYRTNVWDYPGANGFGADRARDRAMHPTVKPVAMVADAIRDCSHRGGLVLDPFVGSGTTLIAAEKTGRRAAAMELDPKYVDVAVKRMKQTTGIDAVRQCDGLSYDEAAAVRPPKKSGGASHG